MQLNPCDIYMLDRLRGRLAIFTNSMHDAKIVKAEVAYKLDNLIASRPFLNIMLSFFVFQINLFAHLVIVYICIVF